MKANLIFNRTLIFSSIFIFSSLFYKCEKEGIMGDANRQTYYKSIDPRTEVSLLSRQLKIAGENKTGNMPTPGTGTIPQIQISQASASITDDNLLFIPFTFSSVEKVAGMYLQLKGSDNYWRIPVNETSGNVYTASIGIPKRVSAGSFEILYELFTQSEKVGNQRSMQVGIVPDQSSCDAGSSSRVDGSDGLTVRSFNMGDKPGKVRVNFDTYTVKDRIDIRYNGKWVKSTGALLADGITPPIKRCSQAGANDGFVGASGTFEIDYDPAISKRIDVYVSGCLDGGTQWYFNIFCPGNNTVVEHFYDKLPDCPCTYKEVSALFGKKTSDPKGEWNESQKAGDYHYGATNDIRWTPDVGGDAGQQCTYDSDGKLITSGIAAGTPDKIAPGNRIWLPFHFLEDVNPWSEKTCRAYLEEWKANTGNCGKSNPVSDVSHINLLYDKLTCEDFTDLLKAANDKKNEDIPIELRDYLIGKKKSGYYQANLLRDFTTWRNNLYCINPFGICNVIDKAISKLK